MILIIDYGIGNTGSILNMLKKIGADAKVSNDKTEIQNAEKLILAGVGAYDHGISQLYDHELIQVLNEQVLEKEKPILGICLGFQLFTDKSDEGIKRGLGWIKGNTKRFNISDMPSLIRVPHMGWNNIKLMIKDSPLFRDSNSEEQKYYFVHSYYVECKDNENILCRTEYGIEFTSAIQKGNIYGVQFHPEKSHKYGMQLLKNFVLFA